ncbi:hypothetical protein SLEP1_g52016 [Rubroshorea leprosula]|uniref:Uncharacterized protein n=1 Tax=Rubroshorea leprosula TaxID=152421 RepID=A0AAV5M528_9ROSI|nr:hypothetical protein SLEP1_g52016 [Rubroshorea leprosula]
MAFPCMTTFQVRCSVQKPSISTPFQHFNTTFSSAPFLKELQQLSLQTDVLKTIKNMSTKLLDAFVDSTFEFVDQPLSPSDSNFAPVDELEEAVVVTNIEGEIPNDFPEGVYIRNGPNPLHGGLPVTKSIFGRSSYNAIESEGMLHAVYFSKGNDGNWTLVYNNRYLRFGTENKHVSNTNVFGHSGKFYASAENFLPQEIDIFTLETVDSWDVNGAWTRPFTTHPKRAPGTGELVIMGIDGTKPYVEVGIISADGQKLLHRVDLKLDRATVSHEIGVTPRYNIFMDYPLVININRLLRGDPLLKFEKDGYSRIGVMPRFGDSDSIKWFDVKPNCTLHLINSFEDGDEVVVWGCRALESVIPGPAAGEDKFEWYSSRFRSKGSPIEGSAEDELIFSRPYEWRLNMQLQTGDVKERFLARTEFVLDFPTINQDFFGVQNKFAYTQVVDSIASSTAGTMKYGGLAKLYLIEEPNTQFSPKEGQGEGQIKVEYHMFEENTFCTGAAFVPKQGGGEEDDGWIITFLHNEITDVSQVLMVDTKNFSKEPVARIKLPYRSNSAPVDEPEEAVVIRITATEGRIPDDFPEGVYIRNGPKPLFGGLKSTMSLFGRSSHIWVEGEGMLHALYFRKGIDGNWTVVYNNRHVETETFKLEKQLKKPSFLPTIEGDSLSILSAYVLNVRAPGSGELVIILGINATKPFVEVGVVSADGQKLVHKVDLKLNRCSLSHEIGVTQRLIKYQKEGYARISVMPRYGDADSIRWFDVEPNCTLYLINCFEDGDEDVVRGCRALESIIPGPDGGIRVETKHANWVKERNLMGNNFSMDFPMVNGAYSCVKNKYGYTQVVDSIASSTSGMAKYGGLAKLYFEEPKTKVSSVLLCMSSRKFRKDHIDISPKFIPSCNCNQTGKCRKKAALLQTCFCYAAGCELS